MQVLNFLISEVFVQAPIFLGLIALIGLIMQQRKTVDVIEGTAKTIVGILILNAGIDVFLSSLLPLTSLLTKSFGVEGVLPDCFGPFGLVMKTLAREVSLVFILAFATHLLLVRILPFKGAKNVFLTGHIMLFESAWFVLAIRSTMHLQGAALIAAAAVFTGALWTLLPAIARPFTRELTGDEYTLGHLNSLAVVIGDRVGRFFKDSPKSDELNLPGFLSVFTDYTVLLSFLMPLMYMIIGLIAGAGAVGPLTGGQNWVIWLILSGLKFAAGVGIVLFGVRTFLAAIIPAFEGISKRLLPGARAALDCPVFYPFAPVGSMIGFVADFAGSVLVTLLLILFKSPLVVFPGPIFFFFDGALAGVFGDRVGGWKGAAAAGFLAGVLVQVGSVLLIGFQPELRGSGLMFSGPDMVLLLPLFYVFRLIGGALGLA